MVGGEAGVRIHSALFSTLRHPEDKGCLLKDGEERVNVTQRLSMQDESRGERVT